MCGKNGKYFEEEKQLNIKLLNYFIIKNIPYGIIIIPVVLLLLEMSVSTNSD